MFKSLNKLANVFRFKGCIPKELTSGIVYKFQCELCNESDYGQCVRHLNARIGEHIRFLTKKNWGAYQNLTKKKVKPKRSSAIDHLLLCNHSPSFESLSVLAKENRKRVLELKESLLIMRDKPSLNRSIKSIPLYLFHRI